MEALYQLCDVYYQPSILESHGIAVLGAMYFERPCVVSNQQGLPESIIDNISGLIVPIVNPIDSAEAILLLLNGSDKAMQLGKEAKTQFDHSFTKIKWLQSMDTIMHA